MDKLVSINPADNSVNGEVLISSEKDIQEKVQRAHDAKAIWKSYGVKKRIEILRPLISAFKKREKEIMELTVKEMGKPITETDLTFDFEYLEGFFNEAPAYLEDEITYKKDHAIHRIVFEPRGVVASIAPWNFPFTNFAWTVIPNLIAGNTVVFKHSEICPLLGKLCEDVMCMAEAMSVKFSLIKILI
jgi:succinate-semialdehyde dehydrogenase/glutarate-semialdehyde dehydrogenase